MSKLLTMLMVAALALTMSGFAAAQNQQPPDPAGSGATVIPPAMSENGSAAQQPADPSAAAGGATASQRDLEYSAALKKCEPLTSAEKTRCVDAARKKSGQI
jgi:hypothetical protein